MLLNVNKTQEKWAYLYNTLIGHFTHCSLSNNIYKAQKTK